MFTGLVQNLSPVLSVVAEGSGIKLSVAMEQAAAELAIGDSVAINGCCLTVVSLDGPAATFQAGEETLSRTNLGKLKVDDLVNTELALKAGDPIGGHYVTGHIDALGTVDQRNEDGEWAKFWFRAPRTLMRQMASKGSIAVDGVSLTLVDVEAERFSVAVIPHTLAVTTLGARQVGDSVNLETDLLAKYVERQLVSRAS